MGRLQLAEFQEQLAALARSERCWVVITVRADFYADVMASPLWPEIRAHRVEVAPLADGGLRAAIIRPAAAVGVHVEPALVERLVADAAGEPGVLPLVQEALVLSWEGLERRFLPVAAYESIGQEDDASPGRRTGIQAAMASRADAALAELPRPAEHIARRVFVRLVEFGQGRADTRRQQRVDELAATGDPQGELDGTVAVLVDDRLLTVSGGDGDTDRRVDLAHEALITGWPTLRGWLDERREAEQVRRRLKARADDWVRLGRGRGGLLDEIELVELERWLAGPDAAALGVDPACTELAVASRTAVDAARTARRRRLIAVVGSLVVVLVVVTVLALWAVRSRTDARDAATAAEGLARSASSRRAGGRRRRPARRPPRPRNVARRSRLPDGADRAGIERPPRFPGGQSPGPAIPRHGNAAGLLAHRHVHRRRARRRRHARLTPGLGRGDGQARRRARHRARLLRHSAGSRAESGVQCERTVARRPAVPRRGRAVVRDPVVGRGRWPSSRRPDRRSRRPPGHRLRSAPTAGCWLSSAGVRSCCGTSRRPGRTANRYRVAR